MLTEGRVYGGGLHKLDPKELAKVPAIELAEHFPESANTIRRLLIRHGLIIIPLDCH